MTETPDTKDDHPVTTDDRHASSPRQHNSFKRLLMVAAAVLAAFVITVSGYVGYLYASTPLDIRQPLYEHYHFRMQLIVDGKPVNFAGAAFQEGYSKDNCNANLTSHPIHMHDNKDQFVHIHWEGMTGGQVLKYYGWNLIGGTKGSLGYRFDDLPKLQSVPIHGDVLPAIPDDATFYVYSGDENGYKQRQMSDFTSQDLEKFFGKVSNSPSHQLNKQKRPGLADRLFPHAYALAVDPDDPSVQQAVPNTPSDGTSQPAATTPSNDPAATATDSTTQAASSTATPAAAATLNGEELKRLNNLVGNVVIFVQKDKPSDAQIKDRFDHLEPLSESTCAG